jgi:ribosome maturation factor RimP
MNKNPQAKKIERAITPAAEGLGYEIVRVLMVGAGSGKPTLQIMAERPDGTMGIEDCERLSRAVSAGLDVENVVDGAYYLELSSPGIDRPLTRLKDFETYKGHEARVEIDEMIDNQKKFKGVLKGTKGSDILLETEKGVVALPFNTIEKAKLALTDELVKSAQRKKG